MVEPDKKAADLEDTVRNLREENAKLLQLLRSQGLLLDSSINQNEKSSDTIFSISNQQKGSTSITFDHSDLTVTTNSINKTNLINNQHTNNHSSINEQSYGGPTVDGNQSNISPSFNTVIQITPQPFVQNSSNTVVQNNTNLIQPINLVNFNNVSLDSIQSIFASQNNLVYLSQTSSSSTTTTATSTNSIIANTNLNESLPPSAQSIFPSAPTLSDQQNNMKIRPKLSLLHQNQELVPVITKIKPEHYENMKRHLSSSSLSRNSDTNNLLDNDSNDSKNKYPRPIRPKPSSRTSSLKVSNSVSANQTRTITTRNNLWSSSSSSSFLSNNSPTVSLLSSSTNYVSQSSTLDHQIDSCSQLIHSRSLDLSIASMKNSLSASVPIAESKKSSKTRACKKAKTSRSSAIVPSNSQSIVPITPYSGPSSTSAIVNVQRAVTSNNSVIKRSITNKKQTKRNNSKILVQCHSESLVQQNPLSPADFYAESISGLLETFDPELLASNFLNQAASNLLSDNNNSIISSNINMTQTSDHGNVRHPPNSNLQSEESYHLTTTAMSMPTLDEFNNQLENGIIAPARSCHGLQTTHDYNVDNEHITSFMNEEDMRFVEMNFDENIFLKQFDLEDPGIKSSVHSDQNFFAHILTNNNDSLQIQQQNQNNQQSTDLQNQLVSSTYSGTSLINNNVFTTVVPLGSQQQLLKPKALYNNNSTISLVLEEGFQLTARHIEPSQVATYESAEYQDILDDLVTFTDQDVLRHVQEAAANDPSIESADFSLALLEAANEIMKSTNIQIVEQSSSDFNELQYIRPIEQQETNLEKQLEIDQNTEINLTHDGQRPIVTREKLQSKVIASTNLTQNVHEESIINTPVNDLSSMIEFDQAQSPIIDHDKSITNLITPIKTTKNISHLLALNFPPPLFSSSFSSSTTANSNNKNNDINIDCHLTLSSMFDSDSTICHSSISDALAISSNPLQQPLESIEPLTNYSNIVESVSLPSSSSSLSKSSNKEIILDSGRLDELNSDHVDFPIHHDDTIEELLHDTNDTQYEIIENQGQTLVKSPITINNVDELMKQIEASSTVELKRKELFEQAFLRYREKYYANLQHQLSLSSRKSKQHLIIPTAKVKISSRNILIKENQLNWPSSPKRTHQDSSEQQTLKIKIRTSLSSTISTENKIQDRNVREIKRSSHNNYNNQKKKRKSIDKQSDTECVGLARVEDSLSQLYHQSAPPTPAETITKDEILASPFTAIQQPESESLSNNIHSGFMINEQTPPSNTASIEHKHSPPPLLVNQTKNEKLKMNYSHLFNYDNNNDHQNNNAYITPPPEVDNNLLQQESNTYENFCQYSSSINKKKHHHRKSSVTSSTSSKSLNHLDYVIDTQELEPVSPTPLSTSKKHHSQNQSSSSSYNDVSPSCYEHPQKHSRNYRSKKSSSNKSSRITSAQKYSQSRSLSNHSYRTSQEPSLIPPMLPVPVPPPFSPPPPAPSIHVERYGPPYHPFASRVGPPPFFNFPCPHPFINPRPTASPAHFLPHALKYPHHLRPSHVFPAYLSQHPYHVHLQRQQQYNNSNYFSSRDHHSFDR